MKMSNRGQAREFTTEYEFLVLDNRQCHNRALFLRRRPCQFPLLRFSSKMRYGSRTAPEFRNLFFQRHSYTQATCNGPTIFERRDELPAMMPRTKRYCALSCVSMPSPL